MEVRIIGISELLVSNDPNDVLKTFSLGSCIGISMYDPIAVVGGLLHIMLPLSKSSPEKAKTSPGMFADTGLPLLLQMMLDKGASQGNLVVKIAGGAQMMDKNNFFNIGQRNLSAIRSYLWKKSMLINAQDVGGSISRTMWLTMGDGRVFIKSVKGVVELCKEAN